MKKVFLLLLLLLISACVESPIKPTDDQEAGVCLTFDDDYVSEWSNMSATLIENKVKATFFITKPNRLSDKEFLLLNDLQSNGFEIGCHGYKHINADQFLMTHNLEDYYEKEIAPALKIMNDHNLYPKSFSYPYGMNNDSLDSFLLDQFEILRDVTDEQRHPLNKDLTEIDEIFHKKNKEKVVSALGIDINFKIDSLQLDSALKRAKLNNEILVLYAHCPVKCNAAAYQINESYLDMLISLIEKHRLKTYNFSDL